MSETTVTAAAPVTETVTDPLTPAAAAPKLNVKRVMTTRLIALVSEHLNDDALLDGLTDEQKLAARKFVSNYFSYGPGVQTGQTSWPENFDAITALKPAKK